MTQTRYLSTTQLASILGISRIAVFKKIKSGEIKAIRIGRNYAIDSSQLGGILRQNLNEEDKSLIDRAVSKAVKEYGETMRLLGQV
jgi:excisionase family DNA binding protein